MECILDFEVCSIDWKINDQILDLDDPKFTIEYEIQSSNMDINKFEGIKSKLAWNLEQFEDERLNHDEENFTVSCGVKGFMMDDDLWDIESTTVVKVQCKLLRLSYNVKFSYYYILQFFLVHQISHLTMISQ